MSQAKSAEQTRPPRPARTSVAAWLLLIIVAGGGLAIDIGSKRWAFANVAGHPIQIDRDRAISDTGYNPIPAHGGMNAMPGDLLDFRLVLNSGAVESGFMSVLPIEPVYELLVHHCILPREQVTWADELFGDPDTHERNLFEDTELLSNPVPLDRNNDA